MRKTFYYGLFCLVIFNGLLFANTTTDPNKAVSIAMQPQPQNSSVVLPQQQSLDYQQKLVEEKLDSFQKQAEYLKWAITTMLVLVGFIVWKNQKDYRESLNDVKDALKDAKEFAKKAEESCSHAEEWEKKSKQAFESIDEQAKLRIDNFNKTADSALKELDEKAKKHLKELFDEAQKQRELSEKWSKVFRACEERKTELACDLLSEMRKDYPDDLDIVEGLAVGLKECGQSKDGGGKEELYQKAEKLLLEIAGIKKGTGAYSLACLFALRGDEKNCQKWLKVGEEAKTLFTREEAMKDEDFASMRDKDWFKAIRWKGEQ